jgi:topoisomerase-4 subunit B
MGKNTPDRQNFIIDNLKIEKDIVFDDPAKNEDIEETEAA